MSEIAPLYADRTSGFTSIVKLGRRIGDGAMMVRMSLIEGKETPKETKENNEKSEESSTSEIKEEKSK